MKVQPKSQGAHVAAHHTSHMVHSAHFLHVCRQLKKEVYLQIHLFILGCIYYCASVHVCAVYIFMLCTHRKGTCTVGLG